MSESVMKISHAYILREWRSYLITTSIFVTPLIIGSTFNLIFIAIRIVGTIFRGIVWVILYTKLFVPAASRLKSWAIDRVSTGSQGSNFLAEFSWNGGLAAVGWIKKSFDKRTAEQRTLIFLTITMIYFLCFALGKGGATLLCLLSTPLISINMPEKKADVALGASLAALGGVAWTTIHVTLFTIIQGIPTINSPYGKDYKRTPCDGQFASPLLQNINARGKGLEGDEDGECQVLSVWSSAAVKIVFTSEISIMDQIVRLVQNHDHLPESIEVLSPKTLPSLSPLRWGRLFQPWILVTTSLAPTDTGPSTTIQVGESNEKIKKQSPSVFEFSDAVRAAVYGSDSLIWDQDSVISVAHEWPYRGDDSKQDIAGVVAYCEKQAKVKVQPEDKADTIRERQRARASASLVFACAVAKRVQFLQEQRDRTLNTESESYSAPQDVDKEVTTAQQRGSSVAVPDQIKSTVENVSKYSSEPTYKPVYTSSSPVYVSEYDFPKPSFEDASTTPTGVQGSAINRMDAATNAPEGIVWKPKTQAVNLSVFYWDQFLLSTAFTTALAVFWLLAAVNVIETAYCGIRGSKPRSMAAFLPSEFWASLVLIISAAIVIMAPFNITEAALAIKGSLCLQWFSVLIFFRLLRTALGIFLYFFSPQSIKQSENTLLPGDVTIIMTTRITHFSTGTDIERALLSILSNVPRRIILSTVSSTNHQAALQLCSKLSTYTTPIELVSTSGSNPQEQFNEALGHVKTPITCLVDDNIIWPMSFLRCALSAFEDDRVGIVETVQRGVRVRGGSIRQSWRNFMKCMEIERINWEKAGPWKFNGGASVISGSNICFRTEIMNSSKNNDQTQGHQWNNGLSEGDGELKTRHYIETGWKTAFLNQREALVYVVFGYPSLSTNSIMSSTPAPRTQSPRRPTSGLLNSSNWFVSNYLLSLPVNLSFAYDAILFFTLYTATGAEGLYSLAAVLIMNKLLQSAEYLYRQPRDFVFVLANSFLGYLPGFVEIWESIKSRMPQSRRRKNME